MGMEEVEWKSTVPHLVCTLGECERVCVCVCARARARAGMCKQKGGAVLQRKLLCGFEAYTGDSSCLSSFPPSLEC